MGRRHYTNTATATTTTGSLTSSATSVTVATQTGWPVAPYTAAIERATASEELVLVTAIVGTTLTITRGYAGTTGKTHLSGVVFEHVVDATDADEANSHVNNNSGVHGATGSVVGTTDAQTVTNKTISSSVLKATSTDPGAKTQAVASGSAPQIQSVDNAGSTTVFQVARGGNVLIQPTDPAVVPLTAKLAAAQTANGVEVQSSAGVRLFVCDASGRIVHKPALYPAVKFIPPDTTSASFLQLRDSADAVDQFLLTADGQISSAAKVWLRGFSSDDPIRYPLDGSKLKVDSSGNLKANNMGGRVATLTDGGTTTSAGTTEQLSSTNNTVSLVNGRRYGFTLAATLGASASDGNSVITRVRVDTAAVSTSSTAVVTAFGWSPLAGGIGQFTTVGYGEFVASSTATHNVKASVHVRVGGGSGNGQQLGCTIYVAELGV